MISFVRLIFNNIFGYGLVDVLVVVVSVIGSIFFLEVFDLGGN